MTIHRINRFGGEAIYKQISKILEEEILSTSEPGDCLQTEQQLAERFCVNRHTIRRAIDELIDIGLVERRHGVGTYVLAPVNYPIASTTRFTETLSSVGRTTNSQVIHKLVTPASEGVARRLQLTRGAAVVWIETLRKVDGIPFCVISHFLPLMEFADVLEDYEDGSLHNFLLRRYALRLERVESLVTAVLPNGKDASLLQMPARTPVLRTKSINIDVTTRRPKEYAVTRFRADRAELKVTT